MSDCYSAPRDFKIFLSQVADPQIWFRAKSPARKPRGKCAFRQGDVTRAIKAVRAAGMTPMRALIKLDGHIVLDFGEVTDPVNDWDELHQGDDNGEN